MDFENFPLKRKSIKLNQSNPKLQQMVRSCCSNGCATHDHHSRKSSLRLCYIIFHIHIHISCFILDRSECSGDLSIRARAEWRQKSSHQICFLVRFAEKCKLSYGLSLFLSCSNLLPPDLCVCSATTRTPIEYFTKANGTFLAYVYGFLFSLHNCYVFNMLDFVVFCWLCRDCAARGRDVERILTFLVSG